MQGRKMLAILVFVLTMNLAPIDHHDRVLNQPRHSLPVLLIEHGKQVPIPAALPLIKS
jgi:hypothetical protein